ncbi:hypothetical protein DERF_006602 [Dermatophagoides farinae]|uniref:Uncharacterized protein n=1 Tax=Dermatophagoides farinae TaxID=6954 RepID=A0A922HYS0_DERFA|nr:hypothetical protein DERF_006602 [Dermatophagoides farinae]
MLIYFSSPSPTTTTTTTTLAIKASHYYGWYWKTKVKYSVVFSAIQLFFNRIIGSLNHYGSFYHACGSYGS